MFCFSLTVFQNILNALFSFAVFRKISPICCFLSQFSRKHFQCTFFVHGFTENFPKALFFFVTVLQFYSFSMHHSPSHFSEKVLQYVVFLSQFSIRCFQCVVFPVTVFQKICCNIIQILHC